MIKFVRKYIMFNRVYYDVLHVPSYRIYTYNESDLPKTVKAWLTTKTPKKQYDSTYNRDEYIFQ